LEVRSKAMGGDFARLGTVAGGVSTWGGEFVEEVARDMVVPGVVEAHPAYARLTSEANDARARAEFQWLEGGVRVKDGGRSGEK